jgi:hypothetical protein
MEEGEVTKEVAQKLVKYHRTDAGSAESFLIPIFLSLNDLYPLYSPILLAVGRHR